MFLIPLFIIDIELFKCSKIRVTLESYESIYNSVMDYQKTQNNICIATGVNQLVIFYHADISNYQFKIVSFLRSFYLEGTLKFGFSWSGEGLVRTEL